jgi:hypothetical protein
MKIVAFGLRWLDCDWVAAAVGAAVADVELDAEGADSLVGARSPERGCWLWGGALAWASALVEDLPPSR